MKGGIRSDILFHILLLTFEAILLSFRKNHETIIVYGQWSTRQLDYLCKRASANREFEC